MYIRTSVFVSFETTFYIPIPFSNGLLTNNSTETIASVFILNDTLVFLRDDNNNKKNIVLCLEITTVMVLFL